MKKVSRHEEKKNRGKRAFAALHCAHYPECLDTAAKSNERLECHKCERLKMIPDIYQKEMGVEAINNQSEAGQSIGVEHYECKTGAMDINRQSNKQGRKIMEEHSNQNSEVGDQGPEAETQICKEKDCGHGGKPQPIEDFQIQGRSNIPGIRLKICKSCMTKKRMAGKQRTEKKRQVPEVGGQKSGGKEDRKQVSGAMKDNLQPCSFADCFTDHPKSYQELIGLAEAELRSPENQMLYIVRDFFEKQAPQRHEDTKEI